MGARFPLVLLGSIRMNIQEIKEVIEAYLKDEVFELYDVKETTIFETHALEILIDNDHGPISTEDIEKVHQFVLTLPDTLIPDDMMIEVSSVGIERPLNTIDDFIKAKGKYVYITSDYYKGYATLNDVANDHIEITYQEKTKQKKTNIPHQAISHARRAVKI